MTALTNIAVTAMVLASASVCGNGPEKAARLLKEYEIVYSAEAEPEMGAEAAALVRESISEATGTVLPVRSDAEKGKSAKSIVISEDGETFDYSIKAGKGGLSISAGSCYALEYASDRLGRDISEGRFGRRYEAGGNMYGETVFEREEGSNLRILDINVWEWNGTKEELPKEWVELGEDCTNEHRSIGFAGIAYAYMPEVICLQEYANQMHEHLCPRLQEAGYTITFIPDNVNFTPIFYRGDKVELLETAYYPHDLPYNNHETKSYTTAVFRMKENGAVFIVINTHLWWKSEKAMAGSDAARTRQLGNIMTRAEELRAKYGCPAFIMGDFNCRLPSEALQNAIAEGYKPAWEIATVYGDTRCGHHACSKSGFSRKQNKPDDGTGCIDHFLVYDTEGKVEVKTFRRDYAYFTIKLTDHYPNYADIRLMP